MICATVAAACGQKSGVHVAASTGGGVDAGNAIAGDQTGTGAGTATGSEQTGGSATAGGGAGVGGTTGGAAGGRAVTVTTRGATGTLAANPKDREGVTDTSITIGIHAPVTGAAPFPNDSFTRGKDLYFKWINDRKGGINGRKVSVEFKDDAYNPSQAHAVCKEMVEQKHVFMLVGGGGTDQIVECAKYSSGVGVPYAAEGVTEQGLTGLSGYFALSMTYKQQALLLAQYIKNVIGKSTVSMIRGDTANFDDAHTAFVAAARQVGLTCYCDFTIPKEASPNDAQSKAGELAAKKADVVYPLMSPKIFIYLAAGAKQQNYNPRYAGVGLTLGLNIVGTAVCTAQSVSGGASFFSPFQGVDQFDAVDPEYKQAYKAYYPNDTPDDIGFVLWGAEKLLGAMLATPGKDLSRSRFVSSVLATKVFNTGIFPKADFTSSRFGGTAVHVLKIGLNAAGVCNNPNTPFITESQNKNGF
jgi:ABC-type branched-subunit amino acid transport system substrate-binding protein